MKKNIIPVMTCLLLFSLFMASGRAVSKHDMIEKVRVSDKDVPEGFIYGKIPGFARNVLKDNPWSLDKPAIKKMANRIYPDGDYTNISEIHMTIMAKKNNPFRDDIVCYVILYKNENALKKEMKKFTSFAENNRDRVILLSRDNLAVYFSVDDTDNFEYIKTISSSVKARLEEM